MARLEFVVAYIVCNDARTGHHTAMLRCVLQQEFLTRRTACQESQSGILVGVHVRGRSQLCERIAQYVTHGMRLSRAVWVLD